MGDKQAALDETSVGMDRDRSDTLNEAIDLYLELHRWQVAHILEGLRQADAEELATDEEVKAAFVKSTAI